MARPTPGERCPVCGGLLSAQRVPRDDERPNAGVRWFRHCEGSSRITPIMRPGPNGTMRIIRYERRAAEDRTCQWIDPDLTQHRRDQNREQAQRGERRARLKRAAEARDRASRS